MGRKRGADFSRRQFLQLSAVISAGAVASGSLGCAPRAESDTLSDTGSGTSTTYAEGTYRATSFGKKSDITVETNFSSDAIESVEIIDHGETERIAQAALGKLPEQIVEFQSLGLDTVTGATLTSMAVLDAVAQCAEQAGGDVTALKAVPGPEKSEGSEELEGDLVVIGAGISGMACALAAAQRGAKVIVFEKSSSMGGNALVSGGFIEHTQAPAELRVDTNDGYTDIFQEILQFNLDAGTDPSVVEAVQKQWDDYYESGNTKLFSSPEFLGLQLRMLEGNTYNFQHTYATDVASGVEWLSTMNYPWMPLVAIPGYSWAHFSGSSEAFSTGRTPSKSWRRSWASTRRPSWERSRSTIRCATRSTTRTSVVPASGRRRASRHRRFTPRPARGPCTSLWTASPRIPSIALSMRMATPCLTFTSSARPHAEAAAWALLVPGTL